VHAESDGDKVNVTLFIPGYSEAVKPTYGAIAFLLLDHALGEYDVEMRVAEVSVKPISQAPSQVCSLEALPKVFDDLLARR
jgi:hypothetical protein